jgi:hypothetical protein
MQTGLHSMHAAALRPVKIAQPFVPRPQPRRATTAARHCTSARATADDQTPQVSCRSVCSLHACGAGVPPLIWQAVVQTPTKVCSASLCRTIRGC